MRVFGTFATFALILAISGIYAVLAFDVAGRVAEIGLRRALGADTRGVLNLVMRRAGRQVAIGLLIGLPLAAIFSVLLSRSLMPGTSVDPWVYLSALLVLLVAVALAATLPLRRALRVDPVVALRHE
jgi:putative ABC transport system permease protein